MEKTKLILKLEDCVQAAAQMAHHINTKSGFHPCHIYGVPRGGVPVSYLVSKFLPYSTLVPTPDLAQVIVDDIIDSGATKRKYELNPAPFLALTDFMELPEPCPWVVFPWEVGPEGDESATDIVTRLLQYIGEDPTREGLQDTPKRVLKAWKEWCSGYGKDPAQLLKCFQDGSENYDEMVIVRDLPFYSMCEHHCAPFFGTATIAYIPNKRIVGLSKLGRLLEMFARRLQVQERLTTQIADTVQKELEPRGVAVLVKARHLCMESRGLSRQGHHTVTSALRGVFREDAQARQEFLNIAK